MKKDEFRPAHVLLVEDNEGDIMLTLEAFEEYKMKTEISVVRNGKEALDFLFKREDFTEAKSPDLVLLDINMPVYSGHEVLQRIKEDPMLKKIPVIMLTTSSNQRDLDIAYENHCNSYIRKPLDFADFLKAVQKIEEFWLELCVLPK